MANSPDFDIELIKKYDHSGPRYTSYPTAVSFRSQFTEESYRQTALSSNEDPIPKPLSLYFHIPFCDTICFYCACNKIATKNRTLATEYLQRLHQEIEMQASLFDNDRLVEQLHWGGGTPTFLNNDEMAELMAVTRRHFNLIGNNEGEFSIEIDPRSVNKETISHLSDLGFNRYSLGVQDVDPEVQKAVNRIQPQEMNQAVIDACREVGAKSINIDLIYGLPLQTVHGFSNTLDAIIDMSPDRLSVFNYAHLPERFKPQRRIIDDQLPSAEERLDILQMSIDKLTASGYVYIGMDHFARPDDELNLAQASGTLHRNFQGYTTHGDCDLIGLGVSSIGKVSNSYSQNEKDLPGYYKAIDNGHLPVIKGITLDFEDTLRRSIIQELICNFSLEFKSVEQEYHIDFVSYFASELALLTAMEADGLLAVTDKNIEVLSKGRLLIRNICMTFDAHTGKQGSKPKFSRVI